MCRTPWPRSWWRASWACGDDVIRKALSNFKGVGRRFSKVGEWNGAAIIDDYAHNPFKIAAALKAARQAYNGPVVAVVQPHRFTRLRDTFEQFAKCLNDADVAIIAPVYAAGEKPIEGINRDSYAEALRAHGHRNVLTIEGEGDLAAAVAPILKPGGVVVCLGAGSISAWMHNLQTNLEGRMTRPCDMLPPVRGTYHARCAAEGHGVVSCRRSSGRSCSVPPMSTIWRLFLAARSGDMPVHVIGVGSNLLVRDGGIPGVVVRLPASFWQGSRRRARASAPARRRSTPHVARAAADAGIAGLEFLRGVPGTIGGALKMNAGCYGREITDIFVEATALDDQGNKLTLTPADMGFSYRKTAARDDLIFVEAVFEGRPDAPAAIKARMEELVANREASQPIRAKTGGSTFKNPPGHKAWELIDRAGCRGLTRGAAQVSEKHCNFLINTGEASAADIEALGEEVKRRVWETQGVALEWEIKRIGLPVSCPAEAAS